MNRTSVNCGPIQIGNISIIGISNRGEGQKKFKEIITKIFQT